MNNSIDNNDFFNSPMIPVNYRNDDGNLEILVPKVYLDKYKITSRDKKDFLTHIKKCNEDLLAYPELSEEDRQVLMNSFCTLFWSVKVSNKKYGKQSNGSSISK